MTSACLGVEHLEALPDHGVWCQSASLHHTADTLDLILLEEAARLLLVVLVKRPHRVCPACSSKLAPTMHGLAVVLEHLRLVEGALVDLLVVLARLELLLVHQHALNVPGALLVSPDDSMALSSLCNAAPGVLAVLAIVLVLEIY